MAALALNWRVWVALLLIFLLGLVRRLWRQWRAGRRRRASSSVPPARRRSR